MSAASILRRTALAGLALAATAPAALAAAAARPRVKREVLAFYYRARGNPAVSGAWKAWQGPNREAPDNDPVPSLPVLGMYDSHDPAVLAQHATWLKQAGTTGVIIGFWNREMWEDRDGGAKTLAAMHAQGLKLTVYIERPKGGLEGAKDDLRYLFAHGMADHPAWRRRSSASNGKADACTPS